MSICEFNGLFYLIRICCVAFMRVFPKVFTTKPRTDAVSSFSYIKMRLDDENCNLEGIPA